MNQKIDTYEIYLQKLFKQDPNAAVLVNSAKELLLPSATLADFNTQILSIYSSKDPQLPEHSSEELSTNLSDILKFALSQMEEEIQRVEVAGEGAGEGTGGESSESSESDSDQETSEGGKESEEEGGEEGEEDITARLQAISLKPKPSDVDELTQVTIDEPKPSDVDELTKQMKQVAIDDETDEESSIESEDEEELRGIIKNSNYYADKILMLLLTNEWPQSRLTEEDLDFKPICSETAKKSKKIIKELQYKLIEIQNYIFNVEITKKAKQESTSNSLIEFLQTSCPEDFPQEQSTILFLKFLQDVLSLNSRRYSISATKIGSGMTFEIPLDAQFNSTELTTQNVLSYNRGQEYKLLSGEYFILHFDRSKTDKPVKILKEVELGKNNFEITGLICGNDVYVYKEGWGKYDGTEEITVIRWREIPKDNVDFACYSIIEESEEEDSEVSEESDSESDSESESKSGSGVLKKN